MLAVAALAALVFTAPAQANANRTFVSTNGSDSNTSVNCSASANCRTFAAALSVTNSGGEVDVVDSGGYGAVTINQPVTISAIGVVASITVSAGNAITINTTGNVTITGLGLHGLASGNDGILVQQVGFLRLYNMVIENFSNDGVDFTGGTNLTVSDSKFTDNGHDGVLLNSTSSRAYVQNSIFDNNAFGGCDASHGNMTVVDSSAQYNQYGFFADGGTLSLDSSRAIYNTNGIAVSGTMGINGAGALFFARMLISDNTNAFNVDSGGTLSGSSPGTTLSTPGQSTVGTPSAAQVLE